MRKAFQKMEEKIMKIISKVLATLCFMLVFSYGFAHAEIRVYDSNKQFLGYGFADRGIINIYVPTLSRFISLASSSGDIQGGGYYQFGSALLYESSDCSGNPYIGTEATYEIWKIGNKLYTGKNIAPTSVLIKSFREYYIGYCSPFVDTDDQPYSVWILVVPAVDVTKSLPFSLPVSLPLSFKSDFRR